MKMLTLVENQDNGGIMRAETARDAISGTV